MPTEITLDEARKMAADAGLTRLTDEQLQQLLRATKSAQSRRASLRTNELLPADEPSQVFRVDAGSDR